MRVGVQSNFQEVTGALYPHSHKIHVRLLDVRVTSRNQEPIMDIDADRHGEDARRLREFTAFDNFSDDDLDRLVRAARHTSSSSPWPPGRERSCDQLATWKVSWAATPAREGGHAYAPKADAAS